MKTKDVINSMSAQEGVRHAYNAASLLQDSRCPEQVAGVALYLNELCQTLGVDARELLNKADRMAKDADTHYAVEVRALREFIRQEF